MLLQFPRIVSHVEIVEGVTAQPHFLDFVELWDTPGMSDPTIDRIGEAGDTASMIFGLDAWLYLHKAEEGPTADLVDHLKGRVARYVNPESTHVVTLNKINFVRGQCARSPSKKKRSRET